MSKHLPLASKAFLALLCVLLLASCDPSKRINKDINYFQSGRDSLGQVKLKELAIQPNDLLNIQIFSKSLNQQQAEIFNITAEQGYLVNADGGIEIPIIGKVTVSGFTRSQAEEILKDKLLPYVKDPSAVVRFVGLNVNVLGEVRAPGTKTFPTDRVTIIDAIAAAGDLTETGLRQNVMVIREERNGKREVYEVDLRTAALFQSPVFQLQQNDLIYVGANDRKLKQLKERKEGGTKTLQIVTSLIAVASSILILFSRS